MIYMRKPEAQCFRPFLFGFTLENAENHVVGINIIDNIINIIWPENDLYRSFEKKFAFSFKIEIHAF